MYLTEEESNVLMPVIYEAVSWGMSTYTPEIFSQYIKLFEKYLYKLYYKNELKLTDNNKFQKVQKYLYEKN